jgi:salicylate hydroxylase
MARARSFYDTAMSLIQPTLLEDWNIEKVQTLLLGARYLQSSNSPDECWNVLGLAIRIAYGLELHRPPNVKLDYIAKETRKRVWSACFGLDKLLSMIYGRPAATSTSTFTTPLPEDLDDDCIQLSRILYPTPRRPSIMSFSIQVAKLYRVLESTSRLYGRGKVTWDTLASTVFSLDEEFEEWNRALPEHLKVHDDGDKQHNEQALILALRANMVRILIHRQSLALTLRFLSGSGGEKRGSEGLKNNMFQYSRNICVQTAMNTITLVGLRHEKTTDAVGPSWFNLYYCKFTPF